jgi:hypothetical protein
MQSEAAQPRRLRAEEEESSTQEPMRGRRPSQPRRNPSTDQKKTRHQLQRSSGLECLACRAPSDGHCPDCGCTLTRHATQTSVRAEQLNPGDAIRLPTGHTIVVKRVRPHQTSSGHVILDTDQGSTAVDRGSQHELVMRNSRQQELPAYGQPGANTNTIPLGHGGGSNEVSGSCPSCGRGQLVRRGDHYVCTNCGYQTKGAGGLSFSTNPFQDVPRRAAAYQHDGRSAIARRARQVLAKEEQ